jgi:hypothetical protein
MDSEPGPWHEGRQAWDRLESWSRDASPSPLDHSDDGERALTALADSGLVRRLLDQVEFESVRTARKHGRSWAEIAVRLGVTRQSAWERWRDVDDDASEPPAERKPRRGIGHVFDEVAADLAKRALKGSVQGRVGSAPLVVVPNVIGRSRDNARLTLHLAGLVAIGPDPDGAALDAPGQPDGAVVDQSPHSGATVPGGGSVILWIGRGGGSGVREPRRPSPSPRTAREMRYGTSDEQLGGINAPEHRPA